MDEALVRDLAHDIVKQERGRAVAAQIEAEWQAGSKLRDLHRELDAFEPLLGWKLVEEKESELPPPRRRRRGDAALRREVQAYLEKYIPTVESLLGPRVVDPLGRSSHELKAERVRLEGEVAQEVARCSGKGLLQLEAEVTHSRRIVSEWKERIARKRRAIWESDEETLRLRACVASLEETSQQQANDLARARGDPASLLLLSEEQLTDLRQSSLHAYLRIDEATQRAGQARQVESECVICRAARRESVFMPCGHLVACQACAELSVPGVCPICRGAVGQVVRVWLS